jgi:hypothetical protein
MADTIVGDQPAASPAYDRRLGVMFMSTLVGFELAWLAALGYLLYRLVT